MQKNIIIFAIIHILIASLHFLSTIDSNAQVSKNSAPLSVSIFRPLSSVSSKKFDKNEIIRIEQNSDWKGGCFSSFNDEYYTAALKYCTKADNGLVDTDRTVYLYLGQLYFHGLAGLSDNNKAEIYFKKAALLDEEISQKYLAIIYKNKVTSKKNILKH